MIVSYTSISYDTLISAISINWNGILLSSSGDYLFYLVNSVGCDSIANSNFTFNNTPSIVSYKNTYQKRLISIVDILGRETKALRMRFSFKSMMMEQ